MESNEVIKIYDVRSLPKEAGDYFGYYADGAVSCFWFNPEDDFDRDLFLNELTHYQKIVKPEGIISTDADVCYMQCESCEKHFDIETMETDADDNYFCKECWEGLYPVMVEEHNELRQTEIREAWQALGEDISKLKPDVNGWVLECDVRHIDAAFLQIELRGSWYYARPVLLEDLADEICLTDQSK